MYTGTGDNLGSCFSRNMKNQMDVWQTCFVHVRQSFFFLNKDTVIKIVVQLSFISFNGILIEK